MTGQELVATLEDDFRENDLLDDEVYLADVLDFLACHGMDGAHEAYMSEIAAQVSENGH